MVVWVQPVEFFLLCFYLPADDGEVKHLNEVGDIHPRVLHHLAILLVGRHFRAEVLVILHHGVLKLHQESLRLAKGLILQDLLGEIGFARTLNSHLQGGQARLVCIG